MEFKCNQTLLLISVTLTVVLMNIVLLVYFKIMGLGRNLL